MAASKTDLNATTSTAALATAAATAPARPAAETPAAEAAPAAPHPQAKRSGDMTPPAPGEKCELCGQTMPDDAGDENGDDVDQETRLKPAAPAAAATATEVAAYTAEMASETVELCTIAGAPNLAAAFVKAKTPLKAVRSQLAARAVAAADGTIETSRPPQSEEDQKKVAAAWDQVVDKINAELGSKTSR